MNKEIISTKEAPAAIGPYSQAIAANGFLYISGQMGVDPTTGALVEGVEAQAHQAFKNLSAILKAKNLTLKDVVKSLVFLKNMDDFTAINKIYADYFGSDFPARSCVEVARLPKDAMIEIEVIAAL